MIRFASFLLLLVAAILYFRARRGRGLPAGIAVLAHRGASGLAPENSLAALRLAADLGAEWAEVDVQRTSDGILLLVHDDSWSRTGGLPASIRETSWERAHGLDVGSWFDARFAAERPPRLEAVLDELAPRLRFNLELKSPESHPGLGDDVAAIVRQRGLTHRVLLTSFDLDVVDRLADSGGDLDLGYLAATRIERHHPRVRCWSLLYEIVLSQPQLLEEAHARGCRVLVWTVDDPSLARRLGQLGVDGIITNRPERLLPLQRRF